MRCRLPYADLDLGDDFEDRTTYQYVSGVRGDAGLPLAAGSGASSHGSHVTVAVTRSPLLTSIDDYVDEQLRTVRQGLAGFQLMSADPWQHPTLGATPALAIRFRPSGAFIVHQVQLFFAQDDTCVDLLLSTGVDALGHNEEEMRAIFASFRLAPPV